MAAFNENGVQMDTWQNPKIWPKHDPLSGKPTGETEPANSVLFTIRRGFKEPGYNFEVKPGDTVKVFRDYRSVIPKLAPHLIMLTEEHAQAPVQPAKKS